MIIDTKLDRIQEKISSIDVTLAAQHEVLKEHVRRTELLEKRVYPIERHVIMVAGVMKFSGIIIATISVLAAIAEILNYFRR